MTITIYQEDKELKIAGELIKKMYKEGEKLFSTSVVGSCRKKEYKLFQQVFSWHLKVWMVGECDYMSEHIFIFKNKKAWVVVDSVISASMKDGLYLKEFSTLEDMASFFETGYFVFDGFDENSSPEVAYNKDTNLNELIVARVDYSDIILKLNEKRNDKKNCSFS